MISNRLVFVLSLFALSCVVSAVVEDKISSFNATMKPLFEKHCIRCHGGEKTKGDVDLTLYKNSQQLIEFREDFLILKDSLLNEDYHYNINQRTKS